jgi:dTDP-4-dehydrorhamnose reductase
MNVLVTGALGQLGRELRRSLEDAGHDSICTDLCAGEGVRFLDIADKAGVDEFFASHEIDVVVNCAAYTDVNGAEDDEESAMLINAEAPGILASAAASHGASMIHVSTDYVFDGNANQPYRETDPAFPLNAYGRTKLAGEKAVAASGCSYVIIRTAWLYSCHGRNFFNTVVARTAENAEMKVVVDQIGTPTYARDLADAIVHIIGFGTAGKEGVYHYTDEGVASWYDFAVEICSGVGHLCDIKPCRSEDFPTKARRPSYSVLDKSEIKRVFGLHIPHWRESLRLCCAVDHIAE